MGYTGNVFSGLRWLSSLKVLTKGFVFVKFLVLAYVLSPRDLGAFGIVTVILSLTEVFTETGINMFLIQTKKAPEGYINTAWSVSIVRGILIALVMVAGAIPLTHFYNEPMLKQLLLAAACIPIAKGFINPAIIFYRRNLEYRKDVLVRFIVVPVEVFVAIGAAIVLKNPMALVISQLTASITEVFISQFFISPRPKFTFHLKKFLEVVRFGAWLNVGGMLAFLGGNIDDLIIGKLLGTTTLGFYTVAYNISQTALADVGDLAAQTIYPVFSRISSEVWRLKRAFFRSFFALSAVLLVPLAVLIFFGQPIVLFLLKEKWLPILPVLPWLLGAAYFQALNTMMSPVYIVRGKAKYNAIILFLYIVAMVPLLTMMTQRLGFVGAGMALLFARLILQPAFAFTLARTLRKRM